MIKIDDTIISLRNLNIGVVTKIEGDFIFYKVTKPGHNAYKMGEIRKTTIHYAKILERAKKKHPLTNIFT